jgi:hypothetical protein
MIVESKDGSVLNQPPTAKAEAKRDAAIAALLGNAPQAAQPEANQHPVQNPSKISPEESPAVLGSKAEVGQSDSNETPASVESSEPKAATEAKSESEDPEQPLSKQYAIIARKEKAIRAKMQELKAKEAELAGREQSLRSQPQAQLDESKFIALEKLQGDPIATLLRAGITYDQITQMVMNQPQIDPATKVMIEEMKAEIKALKGEQESSNKKYVDQQQQAYQQAVKQIRLEANQLVNSDPAYETIKETGSVSDVVELIEETFKADGILLSVEEAAREVEEYLVEQAAKLAKLKKIQQRLAPPKQEAPKSQEPKQQPQQAQMKTLTNAVGSTRQLSAKERAILAFNGELKK